MTNLEKAKVICERLYFPKELSPEELMKTLGATIIRTGYIDYMYRQAMDTKAELIRKAIGLGFINSWRMYKAKHNGH